MEQRIQQLEKELNDLKEHYYSNNFASLQNFRKDIVFSGRVGFFDTEPVKQQTAVTPVGTPSGTYQQSEAQATVTAVNAIITKLQNLGLFA